MPTIPKIFNFKYFWLTSTALLLAITALVVAASFSANTPSTPSRVYAAGGDFINPALRLSSGSCPIFDSFGIMPVSYSAGVQFIVYNGKTWTLSVNSASAGTTFQGFQLNLILANTGANPSKTGGNTFMPKVPGMPTDCGHYNAYMDYHLPKPAIVLNGYKVSGNNLLIYSATISNPEDWNWGADTCLISAVTTKTVNNVVSSISNLGGTKTQNLYLYEDILFYVDTNGYLTQRYLGITNPTSLVVTTDFLVDNPSVFFNNFSVMDYQPSASSLRIGLATLFGAYSYTLNTTANPTQLHSFTALSGNSVSPSSPALSLERLSLSQYSLVVKDNDTFKYHTVSVSATSCLFLSIQPSILARFGHNSYHIRPSPTP